MKPSQKVTVTNNSPHVGKVGVVVSIATTTETKMVSVRFSPGELAVWFYDTDLTLTNS